MTAPSDECLKNGVQESHNLSTKTTAILERGYTYLSFPRGTIRSSCQLEIDINSIAQGNSILWIRSDLVKQKKTFLRVLEIYENSHFPSPTDVGRTL